jgi:hypothetical protein
MLASIGRQQSVPPPWDGWDSLSPRAADGLTTTTRVSVKVRAYNARERGQGSTPGSTKARRSRASSPVIACAFFSCGPKRSAGLPVADRFHAFPMQEPLFAWLLTLPQQRSGLDQPGTL